MRITDRIRGVVQVEIHTAMPEAILNASLQAGLTVRNICRLDLCTLRLTLFENDLEPFAKLCKRYQSDYEIRTKKEGLQNKRFLKRHAVLALALVFMACTLVWSNLHIWAFDVKGCKKLTQGQVLRALSECGVTEGSYWPSLSMDILRSQLLGRLPELAWMTVNVNGSRAVVLVVERMEKPEIYEENRAANIVASHSGIIRETRVWNGIPLVQSGDAVTEGELLVSGKMDSLSNPSRLVRAEASILAETWYEFTSVNPAAKPKTGHAEKEFLQFAIKIGKGRINLFGRSRKALDGYDKIVHEYRLGIGELFVFPVSFITERYSVWSEQADNPYSAMPSEETLQNYLQNSIDGEIVETNTSFCRDEQECYLTMRAHCLENIAETVDLSPP